MFNEANIHALFGYGMGGHAPGLKGLVNFIRASHHQNLAQGRALAALRAERADLRLGTVLALSPVRPSSEHEADQRAAERFDGFWNGAFLDPLFRGVYPEAVAAEFEPAIVEGDLKIVHAPVDFFGVNYYAPAWVTEAPQSLFGAWFGAVPPGVRFTAVGWPVDASGLNEALNRLRDHYGNPEVYVTENGACYDDHVAADGTVTDDDRVAYFREHVVAARRAIADESSSKAISPGRCCHGRRRGATGRCSGCQTSGLRSTRSGSSGPARCRSSRSAASASARLTAS